MLTGCSAQLPRSRRREPALRGRIMTHQFLGIATSNYTTSAAMYCGGTVRQQKKLLPVKEGEIGLRQSDALFHHVHQLPEVLCPLLEGAGGVNAVGVSVRPRDQEGSYMPCFSAGETAARLLAAAYGAPLHPFSHQAGHLAAALFSAGRLDLLERRFLAFHVSGGTTEAVLVSPGADGALQTELAARSLDLKGGQAVDRVGRMLGLPFPAGPALERLALESGKTFRVKPSMRGCDCSLSGIENQCRRLLQDGAPREDVARYCLDALLAALDAMCAALLRDQGDLPVLFAGGVMSNSLLRRVLENRYGACFAEPAFSSDNAAGVAVLAARAEGVL